MQCFKKIYEIDRDYELHLSGKTRKEFEVPLYLANIIKKWNMENNIFFNGYVENINNWLEDKEYIVSSSISEGCPNAILEGMSKGVKPVIHCWPGAEKIFGSDFIFTTPEEFIEVINGPYEPERYRRFVEENFDIKDKIKEIFKILEGYDG
jgi:glycosyltransferase involved in cell wall biosynthesis